MMKKSIIFILGIITFGLFLLDYVGTYFWCDLFIQNGHKGDCPYILSDFVMILFPIIPLFLFSLITYKMREEIFQAWWKFARVWIPVSMLAVLLSPSYTHNWMFPIEKGTVAFFSSAFFVIISVSILGYLYFKSKKSNK
jgi:hypothetical protein